MDKCFNVALLGLAAGILCLVSGCATQTSQLHTEESAPVVSLSKYGHFQDPDQTMERAAIVEAKWESRNPVIEVEAAQNTSIVTPGFESGAVPDSAEPTYAAVVSLPEIAAETVEVPAVDIKLVEEKWKSLPDSAKADILQIINSVEK